MLMQQLSFKAKLLAHLGRFIIVSVSLHAICAIFARNYDATESSLAMRDYQMSMHGPFSRMLCVYMMYLTRARPGWRTLARLEIPNRAVPAQFGSVRPAYTRTIKAETARAGPLTSARVNEVYDQMKSVQNNGHCYCKK